MRHTQTVDDFMATQPKRETLIISKGHGENWTGVWVDMIAPNGTEHPRQLAHTVVDYTGWIFQPCQD